MAQQVKNLPAMQETQVWSLSGEDPLEDEMATHCSILAWKNPMDRGAWQATVHGLQSSWTRTWQAPMHKQSNNWESFPILPQTDIHYGST